MNGNDPSFELLQGDSGIDRVVLGEWSSAAEQAIHDGHADGLILNYARGFRGRSLEFLHGLPLKRLDLLARTHSELDPIYSLAPTLSELHLQTAPTAIDLTRLPELTTVSGDWFQLRGSISALAQLRELSVMSYFESDLEPLRWNTKLRSLVMKDRPKVKALDSIDMFIDLEHLELPMAPLSDLTPLRRGSKALRRIGFSSCKSIDDISPIEELANLEWIDFSDCGDIFSLRPLLALPKLAILMLGTSRILDADLNPVASRPRLERFGLQSRREYEPGVASIREAIGAA